MIVPGTHTHPSYVVGSISREDGASHQSDINILDDYMIAHLSYDTYAVWSITPVDKTASDERIMRIPNRDIIFRECDLVVLGTCEIFKQKPGGRHYLEALTTWVRSMKVFSFEVRYPAIGAIFTPEPSRAARDIHI